VKGIVLAGGTGSRLWPITKGVSKQLLPVYDKPLVHYPIATLMLAGISEIVIITTPQDQDSFVRLLGTGEKLGVNFLYKIQKEPKGIAEAFLIAEPEIVNSKCALILGDNIFYGSGLGPRLKKFQNVVGAQIFGYQVSDPERYGVLFLNSEGVITGLEEKPSNPISKLAIPGLYFYDENVVEISKMIKPSARGELEITEINRHYLDQSKLSAEVLPRGTAWLDTGTFDSLQDASQFVRTLEERQGMKISCLEEISFRNKWITSEELLKISSEYPPGRYRSYLEQLTIETNFN